MGCNHNHSHSHSYHNHSHHHSSDVKTLFWCFWLIVIFMLIEFLAGKHFGSLALLADAGHMANDAFALGLSLLSLLLAARAKRLSFALSMLNAVSLMVIALWIIIKALYRLHAPVAIDAPALMSVAALGLAVNVFVAYQMLKADQDNVNIRLAYLHVLVDLLGSLVAIVAGLAIYLFGWLWVDALASMLLGAFILRTAYGALMSLIRQAWA